MGPTPSVFSHLLAPEFTGLDGSSLEELLDAQAATVASVIDFNANAEVLTELNAQAARTAFAAVTSPEAPLQEQKARVLALRVPPAVKHLAGMLSQYDWAFVEQAKEIRGYVVAQLLEETKNSDARIRLKALELTGKLVEVGSFSERIEIVKRDSSAQELEDRIRSRLAAILPRTVEVQDAVEVAAPQPFRSPT